MLNPSETNNLEQYSSIIDFLIDFQSVYPSIHNIIFSVIIYMIDTFLSSTSVISADIVRYLLLFFYCI